MSYYINVTYPELTNAKPSVLFNSWIGDYKIIDNNNNWTFLFDIYIYGNNYLPPNSFYGNFKTFFTEIENIPINWKETVISKSFDNQKAYSVEKYTMSFDVPVFKSSFFNDYIKYQKIPFEISLKFNTQKLNDYKIDVSQENLDKFLHEINNSVNHLEFIYRNDYYLSDTYNKINFSLKGDIERIIDIYTYNLSNNKPVDNIIRINKFDDEPIIIKNQKIYIDYKIKNQNELKKINIDLNDFFIYDREYNINLGNNIIFDNVKNELIINIEEINKGFYIPYESYGILKFDFDLIYHNKKRHFSLDRQFMFNKDISSEIDSKFIVEEKTINNKLIHEVQNENIY